MLFRGMKAISGQLLEWDPVISLRTARGRVEGDRNDGASRVTTNPGQLPHGVKVTGKVARKLIDNLSVSLKTLSQELCVSLPSFLLSWPAIVLGVKSFHVG